MNKIIKFYKEYKIEFWKYSLYNCDEASEHLNKMDERGYQFEKFCDGYIPIAAYKRGVKSTSQYAVEVIKPSDEHKDIELTTKYRELGWEETSDPDQADLRDGLHFYRTDDMNAEKPLRTPEEKIENLLENADDNSKQGRRVAGGAAKFFIGLAILCIGEPSAAWIVGIALMVHGLLQFASCLIGAMTLSKQGERIKKGIPIKEKPIGNKIQIIIETLICYIPAILITCIYVFVIYDLINIGMPILRRAIAALLFIIVPAIMIILYPEAKVNDGAAYEKFKSVIAIVFALIAVFFCFF